MRNFCRNSRTVANITTKMVSNIRDFYSNKNIFITGGSGFLGLCLLEKILRTIPEHGKIYLLLRPKRGKSAEERLNDIKQNSVFDKLRESHNFDDLFGNKIEIINGDVGEENLGITTENYDRLINNINIIVHSAATLDFAETLRQTIKINLLGTRRCLELAKKCKNLNCFIHVSSAYVNAYQLETEEILYELEQDPDELIKKVEQLNDDELEKLTPTLLGHHLNPYTITKQMAEHEVDKCKTLFPCTIVRPSMIIGSWKEPMIGWTISKNGPQGFLMGASKGVVRRLPVGVELIYDYIPVDVVVNNLLAAGYSAGSKRNGNLEIYHCTSSTRNPFKWQLIKEHINDFLHDFPLKSAVWYPFIKFSPSIQRYRISAFFVHIIPAIILDLITRVAGGRPILMKLHRNVNASLDRLEKFIFTEWKFDAKQTEKLHKSLTKTDQELFYLDIGDLDYYDYMRNLSIGARVYLSKEPLKNLSGAKMKQQILFAIHWALQLAIYLLVWYTFATILNISMSSASVILPIFYILYNML